MEDSEKAVFIDEILFLARGCGLGGPAPQSTSLWTLLAEL